MAKYTVIADTGQRLVEILREALVPQVITNPGEIDLRSPEDRGDVSLGIFLYDIGESEDIYQRGTVIHRERMSKAPIYLNLYYMLTAYSNADVKYRMVQEERILGRVIQLFHDYPVIPLEEIDANKVSGTDLHVQLLRLDADARSKIWDFPNVGRRLSLFYKVSPVTIDSGISREFVRVTEADINVSQKPGVN